MWRSAGLGRWGPICDTMSGGFGFCAPGLRQGACRRRHRMKLHWQATWPAAMALVGQHKHASQKSDMWEGRQIFRLSQPKPFPAGSTHALQAGSGNASRWPVRCSRTPPSSSWTRPPPHWTLSQSSWCNRPLTSWWRSVVSCSLLASGYCRAAGLLGVLASSLRERGKREGKRHVSAWQHALPSPCHRLLARLHQV
jgi:hypothetical protein